MDMHDRLKLARQKAGIATAKEASERLGVPYGTYTGHESGTRGIKREEIQKYAYAYNVSVLWLLFGFDNSNQSSGNPAIIFGEIENSDGFITAYVPTSVNQDEKFIDRLPISGILQGAIAVKSNALIGFAPINSYIYFELSRKKSMLVKDESFDGKVCLIEAKIGRNWYRLIGIPMHKSKNLFDIERFILPTLRSVEVSAIEKVIAVVLGEYVDLILEHNARLDPPSYNR